MEKKLVYLCLYSLAFLDFPPPKTLVFPLIFSVSRSISSSAFFSRSSKIFLLASERFARSSKTCQKSLKCMNEELLHNQFTSRSGKLTIHIKLFIHIPFSDLLPGFITYSGLKKITQFFFSFFFTIFPRLPHGNKSLKRAFVTFTSSYS